MKMITGFAFYPDVAFCLDLENAPVAVTVAWEDGGIQFMEGPDQGCMNGIAVSGAHVRSFALQRHADDLVDVNVTFMHKGEPFRHTIGSSKHAEIAGEWVRRVNEHYASLRKGSAANLHLDPRAVV